MGRDEPLSLQASPRDFMERKRGTPDMTGIPFVSNMVPLKLFFVGYPRECNLFGSGVPKVGLDPSRVPPIPPRYAIFT
jgi:hypothetical protein